ncbi:MAG: hypothetical protein K1X57_06590 [Gemmataceae bacterium]|nr:hypothetical protein [Gemmataceae bacterium]
MRAILAVLLLAPFARADVPPEVRPHVDRAIAGLRRLQAADGSWGSYQAGSTSLVLLAFLESGVATDDPAVVAGAKYVRQQIANASHTYGVSLAIIFLDRLGDKDDAPLIRTLTARLIAGQKPDGGWSYGLPTPSGSAPSDIGIRHSDSPFGDTSNTQFAILGLWAGRRSGTNVEGPLRITGARFRRSAIPQAVGVGWGYTLTDPGSNGARTSAGLLALLLQMGSEIERRMKSPGAPSGEGKTPKSHDPFKDAMVQLAFRYATQQFVADCSLAGVVGTRPDYYMLWSFERAAVAYGVTNAFGVDWYKAGCRRILAHQDAQGLWSNQYGIEVDSSFALLFLARSNFTKDLASLINPNRTTELKTDGTAPVIDTTPTVEELTRRFVDANAEQRAKLIVEYREAKGPTYTDALARLIPSTDGDWPKQLRNALAERLARMTPATLRTCLKDPAEELRRAAAVACAIKEDKEMIPDLIAALDDSAPWVVRACGVALARLTGQDFGPAANASADERAKAVAAWKSWWKAQGKN